MCGAQTDWGGSLPQAREAEALKLQRREAAFRSRPMPSFGEPQRMETRSKRALTEPMSPALATKLRGLRC